MTVGGQFTYRRLRSVLALTGVALVALTTILTVLLGTPLSEPLRAASGGAQHLGVASRVDWKAAVAWTREQVGPADILVNSAGSATRVLDARYLSEDECGAPRASSSSTSTPTPSSAKGS